MIFQLGILGLLQMTVLPGWVWMRAAGLRAQNRCEEALYVFASSLILNQWMVYGATVLKVHIRPFWIAIIVTEIIYLLLLTRKSGWPRLIAAKEEEIGFRWASSFGAVCIVSLALATLLAFIPILDQNWGTVFISNDAVASWDRWAQDWFANRFPSQTDLYPQLLPQNWSITYALMGTSDVKLFAKAIMPLFAAGIPLLFMSLGLRKKDNGLLLAASISGFLFLQYLGKDFLMTGYADVAVSFFSILAVYPLYASSTRQDRYLALFFAAGAATTKQAGLLTLFAIALYLAFTPTPKDAAGPAEARIRETSIFAAAFVALWYVPKIFGIVTRRATTNLPYLTEQIHQGRNYAERLLFGCRELIAAGGALGVFLFLLLAALVFAGLLLRETRILTVGVILPFFLIWGMFFSYEVRTIAMLLPFVAWVSGIAAVRMFEIGAARFRFRLRGRAVFALTGLLFFIGAVVLHYCGALMPRIQASYSGPLAIVAMLLLARPFFRVTQRLRWEGSIASGIVLCTLLAGAALADRYPNDRLLQEQVSAQRNIGKPAVNAELYRLYGSGELNAPVLTDYWYFSALPQLRVLNRGMNCATGCSARDLLGNIAVRKDVGFALIDEFHFQHLAAVAIPSCPGLQTVFYQDGVRLLRIDRSKLRADEECPVDPEMTRPVIEILYPSATAARKAFNVQQDGSAALGIKCRNASSDSVVVWNGSRLHTAFGNTTFISATVPGDLYARAGRYSIEILDTATGLRSPAAFFDVK